ncbi:MAG: hypothetical protein K2I06_11175 [Ruminococcus sp.]|nr:hypothetical protein [Ruminococcus sp.]
MEVFCYEQKKTFRLEDGTKVTGDIGIYKTYASQRNKERYLKRRRNEYVTLSLDDEQVQEVADNVNVEEDVERQQDILLLRRAIRQLSAREQGIVIDYFFNDFSLRKLAKKYGASHTKISSEINAALYKLRQYITDKNS